jgi:TrmH family RNA methyltransferase
VGILLSDGCVDVHNEKVLRSTVGSIFHIPVVENVSLPNAFKTLRDNGYKIIALAGDGEQSIFEVKFGEKNVLVLGSEARGINQEVRQSCDSIFKIPKFGKAESLNVSIACGIGCAMMRM